jgi:ABC-type nitrate/sulfonate/bicarbonate transport system permease component
MRIPISVAIMLGAWQAIVWSGTLPEAYFPGPGPTLRAIIGGLRSGELSTAMLRTFLRAVSGLAGSTLVGLAMALLAARYERLRQAIDPVAELFRPLPPAAIIPMSIFFLGLGPLLYAFVLMFACVWPVYLNARSGLQSVPTVQIRAAASFGYDGWNRILMVQFPSALPEIFIGIRVAAGISLIATVVLEMLTGRDGLGFLVNDSGMTLRIPDMFAALILTMFSGLILNGIVLAARRRSIGWHLRIVEAGNRE